MDQPIQRFEIDGVALVYRVHGNSGRRPLVFVHGYAMNGTGPLYRRLLALLSAEFTVYAVDLRGHGAADAAVAGWSLTRLADDIAAFVAALGLADPIYVGHSIGGFTGLYTELRHPRTFAALCLLATAETAGGRDTADEIATTFMAHGRDRDVMRDVFRPMYVSADPAELEHAVDAVGLMDAGVHAAFFPDHAGLAIADRLGEIAVPVLLVNGARDVVVSPDGQHRTAMSLRVAKEVTFSGEGHMLPMEAPDAAAREIIAFVRHDLHDVFGRR